jgi:hypothetical protein
MNELQEVKEQLTRIESQVQATFVSAEKMRKYFLWTLIITVGTIVIPTIGLMFAIPYYLQSIDLTSMGL